MKRRGDLRTADLGQGLLCEGGGDRIRDTDAREEAQRHGQVGVPGCGDGLHVVGEQGLPDQAS